MEEGVTICAQGVSLVPLQIHSSELYSFRSIVPRDCERRD